MGAGAVDKSGKKRKRDKADKEHPTEPGSTENDQMTEDTPAIQDHDGASPEKKSKKKKKRRDSADSGVESSLPPPTEGEIALLEVEAHIL
jgi:hypothetical protein